jgi:superfamily I DNA/RNA helicase
LLKRYGQSHLDEEPKIIIDTIHSVKGGEADHVVLASKNDYASDFSRKNKLDQSGERKVYYTGASRAKDTLHILSTDYKYHYPIGKDYLIYLEETR